MVQTHKNLQTAIIAVILMFSTVFAEPSDSTKPAKENFTLAERYGTISLNFIPGLGSIVIMHDWKGALFNFALGGGGITLMIVGALHDGKEECTAYPLIDDPNSRVEKCSTDYTTSYSITGAGFIMYFLQVYVFNIYRSVTYNKPGSVAYSKYGDFNAMVLPNGHGSFNTYLMYSKAF